MERPLCICAAASLWKRCFNFALVTVCGPFQAHFHENRNTPLTKRPRSAIIEWNAVFYFYLSVKGNLFHGAEKTLFCKDPHHCHLYRDGDVRAVGGAAVHPERHRPEGAEGGAGSRRCPPQNLSQRRKQTHPMGRTSQRQSRKAPNNGTRPLPPSAPSWVRSFCLPA